MSREIDERVVSMQFDNQHFEKNVQTSLSTLDKLKQKLNLTGASKGLENVGAAAKRVDVSHLGNAVETVRTKFSALEVMGVTALANITNSAVNAGKRMVKALTIDPITTGFNEYETKINSIQTIMSNTASKGTTMEDVTRVIDELNTYADKTIYNFQEMTRNIGTFTAAGVGLEESAAAIQGIANLAAASGSNSQQASTAMYQLSQALAAGTVKLMDWNSVVNAGMGGEKFQEALKQTAREMGISVDEIIKKNGSFRDSLHEGWLTADVLNTTLNKFTKEGAKEYADAMVKSGKYTQEQADALIKEADAMEDAATKVKTFTQLWDTLKESAQSGWGRTWEIIIGDFEEAKEMLSGLSDFLGGFINKMSDWRNNILEKALGNPFEKLSARLDKVTGVTDKMTKAMKNYDEVVQKVIGGDYGTGQSRWDKLAEDGYDWAKVQNLVNEKLGDSTRHEEKLNETQKELNKTQGYTIEQLAKMSEAQLRRLGFTGAEIEAFKQLKEQSEKTGIPLEKLVKDIDQLDGRTLLINSFKNAWKGVSGVLNAVKDAWTGVFPPKSIEERSAQLYNMIAALHKFTTHLKVDKDMADKLTRTFKGLFAIIDIIATVTGGAFKIAFKAVSALLGYFNLDILDVTASIGDAIVKFRDWIDGVLDFEAAFEKIIPVIKNAINAIKDWFNNGSIMGHVPRDIVDGLVNGITERAKEIWTAGLEMAKKLWEAFCDFMGIHSPSTRMFEAGGYIIEGLVNGIVNGAQALWNGIKWLGQKIMDLFDFPSLKEKASSVFTNIKDGLQNGVQTVKKFLNSIDWGGILTVGIVAGLLKLASDVTSAIKNISAGFEGFGDLAEELGNATKRISKGIKNFLNAKALQSLATSLLMLVGAIVVLTLIPSDKVNTAIGQIAVLAVILGTLAAVVGKFGGGEGGDFAKISLVLLAVSGALLIMAGVMKTMGNLSPEQLNQGYEAITVFMIIIGILTGVSAYAGKVDNVAGTVLKVSVAIGILAIVARILGGMDPTAMEQGTKMVFAFGLIIAGLIAATKLAGKTDGIGSTIMGIAGAMLMMALVVRMLGSMDPAELNQGITVVGYFGLFISALMAATNLMAGARAKNIGSAIAGIGGAMLMMALVVRLLGGMKTESLIKGTIAVAALGGIITGLIAATKLAGKSHKHLSTTLLAIAGAIAIMALVAALLGMMKIENLAQGIVAVGLLSGMIALMIHATKGAEKCVGNLVVMTVAITLMAAAIGVLSLLDPIGVAVATACMTALMGMFALIIKVSGIVQKSLATLIVITAAVVAIGGIIYLLAGMPWQGTLAAAAGLTLVLVALTACLLIISKLATPAPMALVAMGLMTLVVAALGGIIYLLAGLPIGNVQEVVLSLTAMLLSMTACLAVLTLIGLAGPAALVGIGSLMALIVGIGGLVVAIGAITEKFPQLETFLNTGIPILEQIGHALGSFFGNIVGGFLDGATQQLPEIGTRLSEFMTNLQPFLDGVKMVDASTAENVGALAKSILFLTAADLVSQLASFIGNGSNLAQLGSDLSAFMLNAAPFIMGASMLNAEMMSGVKALAETVLILTAADVISGLTSWLTGGSSLADFGAQLPELGTNLNAFATNLGTFDESKVTTVTCAANAIKALAEAAESLPNEGGWLAKIVGDNSIETFGSYLPGLATNLNSFATNLGTFSDDKVQTVTCAADAIKALAEAAESLPNEGGWLSKIVGDNSIETFGGYLAGLGTNLSDFATNVGTFDDKKVATVTCAANAIKAMASAAESLPNEGGWLSKIVGDNSIETFGGYLPGLGTNLSEFAANLGTFSDDKVATVNSAVKAISALSKLGDVNIADLVSNMSTLGEKMPGFGKDVKAFADSMSDISSTNIDAAVSKLTKVKNAILSLEGVDDGAAKNFSNALKSLAKSGVDKFVHEFTSSKTKTNIKNAAAGMVTKAIEGVKSKAKTFNTNISNLVSDAVKALKGETNYTKFYNAGKYLVTGFATGISDNSYKAEAKARAMAKAAAEAAEDELDINSPSKVFRAIGTSIPEGFAQGIDRLRSLVTGSSAEMGTAAVSSVSDSLSHMNDILVGDVDSHPTIRPVVDLSGVKTGRDAISELLNMGSDIGVLTNVGAISATMNRRNQNGGNEDVVSAIDKLRRGLDNIGNTTYSIGGVTVTDSDVEDAIQTLVDAIIRDRRS